MKELKIDLELKDLLPPLTEEEYKQLEKNIITNGFDKNFPIITWNGFIVDGHNRYSICKKHNIEFLDRYISYETKEDVMSWMIDTQMGRRNLTPIQRIAVAERYKIRIQKLAKENQGIRSDLLSKRTESETITKPVETRKEIAKIANVGSGTMARYDVVMKSNDEDLKRKMLSEEIAITNAYDELKKKEQQKKQKEITTEKNSKKDEVINIPIFKIQQDNIKEIIKDMKIPKNADDYWNFLNEMECIQENFQDPIEVAFDILFERHNINGRITEEEREIAVDCIQDILEKLEELKQKIKNTKLKGE